MPKMKNKESSNIAQWYVVNAFSGNEDLTIENIKGKVNSYNVSHLVPEIRVVKHKIKKIEEITKENAPKTIRNRKNTT
jgi:transcription antitermination factor NusG